MSYSKVSRQDRFLLISWLVIAILFFTMGFTICGICCTGIIKDVVCTMPQNSPANVPNTATEAAQEPPQEPVRVVPTPEPVQPVETITATPMKAGIKFTWGAAAHDYVSLGEYKLTSYCACEKCCGYWATIRPKDKNGKPIVYTASGAVARQGVTVAADTSILPYGTVLLIGGEEFTVQDCGGGVDGKHIDIYFESHEAAIAFGVQYQEIFIKE